MNTKETMDYLVSKLKDQAGFFQEGRYISCDDYDLMFRLVSELEHSAEVNTVMLKRKAGDIWRYNGATIDAIDLEEEYGKRGECFNNQRAESLIDEYIEMVKDRENDEDKEGAEKILQLLLHYLQELHKVKDDEFMIIFDECDICEIHKRFATHYYDNDNSVEYRLVIGVY